MVLEFTRDNTIVISNHDQKVLKARLFLFGDFYFFHSFHFMEKYLLLEVFNQFNKRKIFDFTLIFLDPLLHLLQLIYLTLVNILYAAQSLLEIFIIVHYINKLFLIFELQKVLYFNNLNHLTNLTPIKYLFYLYNNMDCRILLTFFANFKNFIHLDFVV